MNSTIISKNIFDRLSHLSISRLLLVEEILLNMKKRDQQWQEEEREYLNSFHNYPNPVFLHLQSQIRNAPVEKCSQHMKKIDDIIIKYFSLLIEDLGRLVESIVLTNKIKLFSGFNNPWKPEILPHIDGIVIHPADIEQTKITKYRI